MADRALLEAATEPMIAMLAGVIAKSRYEAWDSHAKGPNAIPWDEYRDVEDPSTALNIYLADGRRDAEALLPVLRYLSNQTTVTTMRDVATGLEADGAPATVVAWVRAHADLRDWNNAPNDTEETPR